MTRPPKRRIVHVSLVAALAALVLLPSLAPATVEEQRTRLPPPATCQDPVEGIWMSHKFESPGDEWMIFTLEIHRAPTTATGTPGALLPLVGHIQAHAWLGAGPAASAPPPCTGGIQHWTVEMTAQGTLSGQRVEFWARAGRSATSSADRAISATTSITSRASSTRFSRSFRA